jgi:hypothetical protein
MAAAKKAAASKKGSSKLPPALRSHQKTSAQMKQMGKGTRKKG